MIPYYALLFFFSDCRPTSEVAQQSKVIGVYNGRFLMAGSGTVPRAKGKGLRCWREIIWVGDSQRSNIDRIVDLTPNSVEWTTWALGELPNNGEVYYDRDLLKAIR